jgi:hypothetical protein
MGSTVGMLAVTDTAAYAGLNDNHCEPRLGDAP